MELNSTATLIVTTTISVSDRAPVPISLTTASARAIPSATPNIIWTALRQRRPTEALREIAAAIGAKNGCGWPSRSWVTYQARPAAAAACRIGHSATRRRPNAVSSRRPTRSLVIAWILP